MAPRKTTKGVQRSSRQSKPSPAISEHTDLLLFENLLKEDFSCQEMIGQLKEVADVETRENVNSNLIVLIFKLVGLNSFVGKLEGKGSDSIDEDFLRQEIEENASQVRDFLWIFTTKKPEHDQLKDNLFALLDSIMQEKVFFEDNCTFSGTLSRILQLLSKCRIENVRQNCVRLTKIIIEQSSLRVKKLNSQIGRKLEADEETLLSGLEDLVSSLLIDVISQRVLDRSEVIQQDSLEVLEMVFTITPDSCLKKEMLISAIKLLDGTPEAVTRSLRLLSDLKWDQSEKSKELLGDLFADKSFRHKLIYLCYSPRLVISLPATTLIKLASSLESHVFSEKEKIKIMGIMFHEHEEVRTEGIRLFMSALKMKEKEQLVSKLNLDAAEDSSVADVFSFKYNSANSIQLIHGFLQQIEQVDHNIHEKPDLIQNLINTIGFTFSPIYDFASIIKLLVQLPASKLEAKIQDFLKIIVALLKAVMNLLAKIKAGEKISQSFTKAQQERLLLVRSEYFPALLMNFEKLRAIMQLDEVWREQISQLFLIIPPSDLQQDLKEATFSPFAKAIADDLFKRIQKPEQLVGSKKSTFSLITSSLEILRHFLLHTPRAYKIPFVECKEKIIKNLILEPIEKLHKVIVQDANQEEEQEATDELKEEFEQFLFKLYGVIHHLRGVEVIYGEDFIQKCLELTDSVISSPQGLYTYASLGLQLDFYLSVLRMGLRENFQNIEKFKEYMRYRPKIFRQLWGFLREERKKRIQFHLEPEEFRKILFKSYICTIEAINFLSSLTLKHLPIFLELPHDDPIFYALADYVQSFKKQKNSKEDDKQVNNDVENKNDEAENTVSILAPMSGISDLQLIFAPFCSLIRNNGNYASSHFGISVLRNFFDSPDKKVAELLRKNLASVRLLGDKVSGFPPFWRTFDKVLSILHEEKDQHVRKLVSFAHRAYFTDVLVSESEQQQQQQQQIGSNPKEHIKELSERQVYYLTAKLKEIIEQPEKIDLLEILGYMLTLLVKWPKKATPEDISSVQQLQRKYQTLFIKKVQDSVKERDGAQAEVEGTITSKNSKTIVAKYLKRLESWSGVSYNVDPYGEGEESLEARRKEAERQLQEEEKKLKEQKNDKEEQSDEEQEEIFEEDDGDEEEEIELEKTSTKKGKKGSKMEVEEPKSSVIKKTKKTLDSTVNEVKPKKQKIEPSKKNHRRQQKNQS